MSDLPTDRSLEEPLPPPPPTAGKHSFAEGETHGSVGNVFGSAAMDVDPAVLQPGVEVPVAEPPVRSLSTPEASDGQATALYMVSSAQPVSPHEQPMQMQGSGGLHEQGLQPSLPRSVQGSEMGEVSAAPLPMTLRCMKLAESAGTV